MRMMNRRRCCWRESGRGKSNHFEIPPPMTPNAERILAGFTASGIQRSPVPFMYRSGMILVLLGMVLLPVAYLALIALASYLTWLWATNGFVLLSRGGGLFKLVIYCAPLAAGLT